jgi:hypothetical protein
MLSAAREALDGPVRTCAAVDGKFRAWNATHQVCILKPWRVSSWLAVEDACECRIPRLALFNSKGPLEGDLLRNTERTRNLTGLPFIFHTDAQCRRLLAELEQELGSLVVGFDSYTDGRIRSDMCRLAMLWRYGGFYFDNDIQPLVDVTQRISSRARFVTSTSAQLFGNPPGFFQAFVASEPRHPILSKALALHGRWPVMTVERKRCGESSRPNIGTVLLRDAARAHADVLLAERTGRTVDGVQLFRELPLTDAYNTSGLCVTCTPHHHCNFCVADPRTGEVLFKSRFAHEGAPCATWCQTAGCVPAPVPKFKGAQIPAASQMSGRARGRQAPA